MARLPSLTALILPVALVLLAPVALPVHAARTTRRAALLTLAGFGASLGLWLLGMRLFRPDALQGWVDTLIRHPEHPASALRLGAILAHSADQLVGLLPKAVGLALLPAAAVFLARRLGRPVFALPLVLLPAVPLLLWREAHDIAPLVAAWLLLIGWAGVHWREGRWRQPVVLVALVAAFFLPWAVGFPSGGGVSKLPHGGWLAPMLAALLWTSPPRAAAPDASGSMEARRFAAWGLALAALPVAFWSLWGDPYRDHPDRLQRLTQSPKSERLAGVRTTPERAASLDEVIGEIRRRTPENATILAYGNVPMLYFATGRLPALDHAWPLLYHESGMAEFSRRLCRPGGVWPELIARTLTNTRNRLWGLSSPSEAVNGAGGRRGLDRQARVNLALLDAAVTRCNPQAVWSNRDFLLMTPQPQGERWRPLEELIEAVKGRAAGEKILAYGVSPLLYFEAGVHPLMVTYWLPGLSEPWGERLLDPICREGQPRPALIVRPKAGEEGWRRAVEGLALVPRELAPGDESHLRPALERLERRCAYVSAWSNDWFEILAPPPER